MVEMWSGARAGRRRAVLATATAGLVCLGGAGLGLALTGSAGATPAGCRRLRQLGPPSHRPGHWSGRGHARRPDCRVRLQHHGEQLGRRAAQNDAKVAQALQALAGNGVAQADMQTTGLNLSAQYASPHGVPTLTGYQASETITATLRHLSTDGTAIDAVVSATWRRRPGRCAHVLFRRPGRGPGQGAGRGRAPGRRPCAGDGRSGRPQARSRVLADRQHAADEPVSGPGLGRGGAAGRGRSRWSPARRSSRTR